MNLYAQIVEIALRRSPEAVNYLFKSRKNGTVYAFSHDGKLIGPYTGTIECDIMMPPELERMVEEVTV